MVLLPRHLGVQLHLAAAKKPESRSRGSGRTSGAIKMGGFRWFYHLVN
jgi:hypothetical protein